MDRKIKSAQELEQLILEVGFLPFFQNEIPGFSVEEHTAPEYWFQEGVDGPWEWKGEMARRKSCAYGKLFQKKAGFVSLEWFPLLANYRRDGYDFDARYEDGLAPAKDKRVMDLFAEHGSLLSYQLKDLGNYRKGGNKGFETVITRLQMQTYVVIEDFEYRKDKLEQPYGWAVSRYTASEPWLGENACTGAYRQAPKESFEQILKHLQRRFPAASRQELIRLMR